MNFLFHLHAQPVHGVLHNAVENARLNERQHATHQISTDYQQQNGGESLKINARTGHDIHAI